jgi:hypothetical protein
MLCISLSLFYISVDIAGQPWVKSAPINPILCLNLISCFTCNPGENTLMFLIGCLDPISIGLRIAPG